MKVGSVSIRPHVDHHRLLSMEEANTPWLLGSTTLVHRWKFINLTESDDLLAMFVSLTAELVDWYITPTLTLTLASPETFASPQVLGLYFYGLSIVICGMMGHQDMHKVVCAVD